MGVTLPADMVAGAIVGVARLAGVAERMGDVPSPQPRWWFGPLAWLLEDVVAIEPVVCRGKQGLWPLAPAVLEEVRRRYAAAHEARD